MPLQGVNLTCAILVDAEEARATSMLVAKTLDPPSLLGSAQPEFRSCAALMAMEAVGIWKRAQARDLEQRLGLKRSGSVEA